MPENIKIIAEQCTGCGDCVPACPFFALEIVETKAFIYESCLECGACVASCSTGAIWAAGEESSGLSAGGAGGGSASGKGRSLWVFVPTGMDSGNGKNRALGGLALARSVADEQGTRVSAVTVGDGGGEAETAALFGAGADEVVVLAGEGPAGALLASAVGTENPAAVLAVGSGPAGEAVAGAAALAGSPLIAGVDGIEVFGERLAPVRPLYGGRFRAKVRAAEGHTPFITLDPYLFRAARTDPRRSGPVRRMEIAVRAGAGAGAASPLPDGAGAGKAGNLKVPLAAARIVIGGGLELDSAESFTLLYKLAEKLALVGGDVAVGATKEAVEAGWAPREALLDGTAVKICPALYLAFGIDGSPAHNAAVALARVAIAVTARTTAQFCQVADFILPYSPTTVLQRMLEITL